MKKQKKIPKPTKAKRLTEIEDDPLDHDMSEFIKNAKWQRVKFEFIPKNKTVTIRMSEDLLNVLKKKAKENGIDYQKFIRLKLEQAVDDDAA